jgi:hypothetical protein
MCSSLRPEREELLHYYYDDDDDDDVSNETGDN